jgi:stage IV sporulation protein FB
MIKSVKLFNFKGSPVNLNPFFFFLLILFSPIEVLLIFLTVLVHEMAHAFVANKKGYSFNSINIGLFFGTTEIDISNIHEKDSVIITFAGPLANFILFSISLILLPLTTGTILESHLIYFKILNLIFAVFNLLPIYPLDGGRIFRDLLYLFNQSRRKSILISASVSIFLSLTILIFSLLQLNIIMAFFMGIFLIKSITDINNI